MRSISVFVTFPFQTIKGAVRYSDEGLRNWASRVEKLSVVSILLPLATRPFAKEQDTSCNRYYKVSDNTLCIHSANSKKTSTTKVKVFLLI